MIHTEFMFRCTIVARLKTVAARPALSEGVTSLRFGSKLAIPNHLTAAYAKLASSPRHRARNCRVDNKSLFNEGTKRSTLRALKTE